MTDKIRQTEALDLLSDSVDAMSRRGLAPVVVFDLDDTLLSTHRRHLRILREFAAAEHHRQRWPAQVKALERLGAGDLRYSIVDSARQAGIEDAGMLAALKAFWRARFFTNAYLSVDEPLPGAAAYCVELAKRGASLVYMTGREENLREGTQASLAAHGFPADARQTALMLKPRSDLADSVFKEQSFASLAERGAVAGAFENEPLHINLFLKAFPDAHMFFLDTKHSGGDLRPHPRVRWIKDFRR